MSDINLPYKDYIKKLYSNYFLKPMKTLGVKYHGERHKHGRIWKYFCDWLTDWLTIFEFIPRNVVALWFLCWNCDTSIVSPTLTPGTSVLIFRWLEKIIFRPVMYLVTNCVVYTLWILPIHKYFLNNSEYMFTYILYHYA